MRAIYCPKCAKLLRSAGGGNKHVLWCGRFAERFWMKVDKSAGPDACWPWTAACFKKQKSQMGYGRFDGKGPWTYAHRAAWMLSKGPIPEGMLVMHSCDNVRCCNPAHLSIGTDADNHRDKVAKGRNRHKFTPREDLLHPEMSSRFKVSS